MRSSINNCNGCNGRGMHNRESTLKGKERVMTAGMSDLFPCAPYYPRLPLILVISARALLGTLQSRSCVYTQALFQHVHYRLDDGKLNLF